MRNVEKLKKKIFNEKTFSVALLIIVIIAILSFIFGLITFNNEILFLTFLALVWYAWETRGMKKTMVEQTALEQKPIIDLFFRPKTEDHPTYFRLRNSGKGVAYNIKVETVKFDNKIFEFYFEDPNLILTSGDEQTLLINAKHEYNQSKECWENDPLSRFLYYIG